MIQSATGLILRIRPLTESSLIVHWLTPEFGRIATVARGARRPKSPFLGKLDLFYMADFSFSRSQRSELHHLRETSLRELHPTLRRDLDALRQATYATAFIEKATEVETPLPAIYELMVGLLEHLCQHPPGPQTVLGFELKMLHELGLEPDWNKIGLSPGTRKISQLLAQGTWSAGTRLKLSHVQIRELQQFLHGFLIFHLGRLPKGRTAALAVPGPERR